MTSKGCGCQPRETGCCEKGKKPAECTPQQIKTCHGDKK